MNSREAGPGLTLTPTDLDLLPTKWEKIGTVLVFNNLPEAIYRNFCWIARYYAEELRADAVIVQQEPISGELRKPTVELVFGTTTETHHIENGIIYAIDPMKLLFSAGNITERRRCAMLRCNNEYVVDMFAGIGYFSLPVAKGSPGSRIVAIEKNPEAFHYLKKNIELNKVGAQITPVLGDNRVVSREYYGRADRVIMGYFPDTWKFLPVAMMLLKRSGGIVMYHDLLDAHVFQKEAELRISKAASVFGFFTRYIETKVIKEYSPGLRHAVSYAVMLPQPGISESDTVFVDDRTMDFLIPALRILGVRVSPIGSSSRCAEMLAEACRKSPGGGLVVITSSDAGYSLMKILGDEGVLPQRTRVFMFSPPDAGSPHTSVGWKNSLIEKIIKRVIMRLFGTLSRGSGKGSMEDEEDYRETYEEILEDDSLKDVSSG